MDSTRISLIVPQTFAEEGYYEVTVEGTSAKISISYLQNKNAVDEITGIITTGTARLKPDDPQGW